MRSKNSKIVDIFSLFCEYDIEYVMLRGVSNLLPHNIDSGKDIDILVSKKDKDKVHSLLVKNYFFNDPRLSEYTYLYGVDRFRYYRNIFYGINIDICFQLTCSSLNNGEIVPLDKLIQNDVFKNVILNKKDPWKRELSLENQIVYEISYAFFNKSGDNRRLKSAFERFNPEMRKDVYVKLETIFFKFTPIIMKHIQENNCDEVYSKYMSFKEY